MSKIYMSDHGEEVYDKIKRKGALVYAGIIRLDGIY